LKDPARAPLAVTIKTAVHPRSELGVAVPPEVVSAYALITPSMMAPPWHHMPKTDTEEGQKE
jgi:hypothetical protein